MNEHEEIGQWFDLYGEAILTYILMVVRDYPLAEDLTQETFLKALKKKSQFQQKASVKTWLFAIAANTIKDYYRKKNPLKYYFNLTFEEHDQQPIPEQLITMSETSEQLYKAIQQLKPPYKQVIILRKLKDFSTEETAAILGWSESKVKMTLKRGLQALKIVLQKGGYSHEFFQRQF